MVALSETAEATNSALPTVLVIDDERGPRESLRILLKPECQVLCADSVDQGVEMLKTHHPDTVVMDIRMPGKNGIEGLRAIRELDGVVSVIMFTGFGALETAQEAIRLGANDYVKKPFDAFEIRGLIRKHVQRTQRERRRKEASASLMRMNQTLREELERRAHLASLGQKSAELVHDLRNPLTVILGYVELLTMQIREQESNETVSRKDKDEAVGYLETIEKSVLHCRDLTDMWLNVSRGKLRRSTFDAGKLIRSVADNCMMKAAENQTTIEVEAASEGLALEADEMQISRAIQNLVINALEAVPPNNGRVRVWCSREGETILIGVGDNGCGMSDDQIGSATEPFYTTKKKSGTGLGLFIVRQVAEAHGGTLKIESRPGQGTNMIMTLPVRPG